MLYTKEMTFDDMLRLKGVEEMVETFYNSSKSLNTIKYAVDIIGKPFKFLEDFINMVGG